MFEQQLLQSRQRARSQRTESIGLQGQVCLLSDDRGNKDGRRWKDRAGWFRDGF